MALKSRLQLMLFACRFADYDAYATVSALKAEQLLLLALLLLLLLHVALVQYSALSSHSQQQ
jgi:hypothetical protein